LVFMCCETRRQVVVTRHRCLPEPLALSRVSCPL
jgi:hypothetical protein